MGDFQLSRPSTLQRSSSKEPQQDNRSRPHSIHRHRLSEAVAGRTLAAVVVGSSLLVEVPGCSSRLVGGLDYNRLGEDRRTEC